MQKRGRRRLSDPSLEPASPGHISVLYNEFLANSRLGGRLLDGTLGLAGHTIGWLKQNPQGRACGIDQDEAMLAQARRRLEQEGLTQRAETCHGSFEDPCCTGSFDTILLDLGISSLHIDSLERGISYREDSLLDMRLDTSSGEPAWEWLKKATEKDIREILWKYGEEKFAPRIAAGIVRRAAATEKLRTTDIVEICEQAVPAKIRYEGKTHSARNPAVKTFQALRIVTNRELEKLEKALVHLPQILTTGGSLIIISFHSLEDRMVKQSFLGRSRIKDESPFARSNFLHGDYELVTPKAIMPTQDEIEQNPRSRSARMRILRKVRS